MMIERKKEKKRGRKEGRKKDERQTDDKYIDRWYTDWSWIDIKMIVWLSTCWDSELSKIFTSDCIYEGESTDV